MEKRPLFLALLALVTSASAHAASLAAPAAPTNFSVTSASAYSTEVPFYVNVSLSWSYGSSTGLSGFKITTANGSTVTVPASARSTTLNRIIGGTFTINAVASAGTLSTPVRITMQSRPAPTAPGIAVSGNNLTVSWTAPASSTDLIRYQVLRQLNYPSVNPPPLEVTVPPSQTSASINLSSPAGLYLYAAVAVGGTSATVFPFSGGTHYVGSGYSNVGSSLALNQTLGYSCILNGSMDYQTFSVASVSGNNYTLTPRDGLYPDTSATYSLVIDPTQGTYTFIATTHTTGTPKTVKTSIGLAGHVLNGSSLYSYVDGTTKTVSGKNCAVYTP